MDKQKKIVFVASRTGYALCTQKPPHPLTHTNTY
jgi:hypothetical protein